MKKVLLFFSMIFAIIAPLFSQNTITEKVFWNSVDTKIVKMQQYVGFNDEQSMQLKKLEYEYLVAVQKAENCFLCNKKKRIEKLQSYRDTSLQKILSREQYVKYEAIENDLLNKNNRIWLQ